VKAGQDSCNLYPEISVLESGNLCCVMLKHELFQILLYIKAKELKQKATIGFYRCHFHNAAATLS
jgi:hypothetical protein